VSLVPGDRLYKKHPELVSQMAALDVAGDVSGLSAKAGPYTSCSSLYDKVRQTALTLSLTECFLV
jgi:hypothetical protein